MQARNGSNHSGLINPKLNADSWVNLRSFIISNEFKFPDAQNRKAADQSDQGPVVLRPEPRIDDDGAQPFSPRASQSLPASHRPTTYPAKGIRIGGIFQGKILALAALIGFVLGVTVALLIFHGAF